MRSPSQPLPEGPLRVQPRPGRRSLTSGRVRPGREIQEASVEEALGYAALRLRELSRKYSGREMAVFVSPRMTNEEIYLAQKFARVALKTHNVTSFSQLANPDTSAPT